MFDDGAHAGLSQLGRIDLEATDPAQQQENAVGIMHRASLMPTAETDPTGDPKGNRATMFAGDAGALQSWTTWEDVQTLDPPSAGEAIPYLPGRPAVDSGEQGERQ